MGMQEMQGTQSTRRHYVQKMRQTRITPKTRTKEGNKGIELPLPSLRISVAS